jgi:hypothetical protein
LAGILLACANSGAGDGGSGGAGGAGLSTGGAGAAGGDDACARYEHQAIAKPVNLYIMFDKSSSMAGSKWEAAKTGLGAFVADEASAGVSVGLRFFPRDPDGVPACTHSAYATPTVGFGALPAFAPAIVAAIESESPNGFSTPIYPALGGALLKGIELAENNPGESSAVLLVTDGAPEGPAASCSGVNPEDPQVIAELAAAGAAYSPPVLTFVVGLPGVDQSTANLIAAAGGTEKAILVGSTNVAVEFQEALAFVRGSALPCSYELPAEVVSGEVALGLVNITVTPEEGEAETIAYDPSCAGDGWHWDHPTQPTAIELCPATCQRIRKSPGIAIRVVLGCTTLIK